jgi:hypothetical protein
MQAHQSFGAQPTEHALDRVETKMRDKLAPSRATEDR